RFSVLAMGAPRSLDPYWDVLRPHFTGLYVSFETARGERELRDAFPPATLNRLRALKRRYDPTNVFRDNFNIHPAGSVYPSTWYGQRGREIPNRSPPGQVVAREEFDSSSVSGGSAPSARH